MSLKQPVGQKRLTNIALVKFRSHGKKFEIACFRNKVKDWRDGKETDLSEVLQTDTIFSNVGKGIAASAKDLLEVFNTTNADEICRIILGKGGKLQVSDKERELFLEELFRDMASICTERLVHPTTKRQLTVQMIMDALKSAHFNLKEGDSAKKQSLKAIELLTTKMPDSFVRANMRLCISALDTEKDTIETSLTEICDPLVIVSRELDLANTSFGITFDCLPSCYRALDKLVTSLGKQARMQVLDSCVAEKEEGGMEHILLETIKKSDETVENQVAAAISTSVPSSAPAGPFCSTCNSQLDEPFRTHCKSELHNFNVKRKVKGLPPCTPEEFQELMFDQEFMTSFRGVD